jgi:hypothetical protein
MLVQIIVNVTNVSLDKNQKSSIIKGPKDIVQINITGEDVYDSIL